MSSKDQSPTQRTGTDPVFHYAIRLLALALLLVWCFYIIQPFISILVWAAVMATTLYPLHKNLRSAVNNRNALSATIITLSLLVIIIGPSIWILSATAGEFKELMESFKTGDLHVPPPPEKVGDWPLVGKKIHSLWTEASLSLSSAVANHQEELRPIILKFFGLLKSAASGILFFAASIIVSGVLLAYAKEGGTALRNISTALAGEHGQQMADHAEITIRNVAKGILGVALLQSMLAGLGMVLAGIPFAGVWIAVCLILAIVQIGILPVSIGVIIYIWGTGETVTAITLTIWMLLVGISDNVLKPIVMGKGAPVPMLVIFIGAIGGFMLSGIIGLFTGAIVLSLGYNLASKWVAPKSESHGE
jgi:predicted PurR-regulated permease PerM